MPAYHIHQTALCSCFNKSNCKTPNSRTIMAVR